MLNTILNLFGTRRMIVDGGEDSQLFGGSYDAQSDSENNFPVEVQAESQSPVLPVRPAKLTRAYGTAAFSMPMDAFNSQLG